MFVAAIENANKFTFPLIMSRKTVRGECSASIGTFMVVNDDGWIVTAGHMLAHWHKLAANVEATRAAQATRAAISNDKTLSAKERGRKLHAAPTVSKDDSDACSLWLPFLGVSLSDMCFFDMVVPDFGDAIDIGIARLEPWDKAMCTTFPVFKDPTKNFEPGIMLCKLGFPFHHFAPTWHEDTGSFSLPPGALPMPRFPSEGMFTRLSEIYVDGLNLPFPIRYVETSTPGLRGQSGGPTMDEKGTVWAVQAKTVHLDLGFTGIKQYLNVGLGAHPAMIFGLFKEVGIKYQISDY